MEARDWTPTLLALRDARPRMPAALACGDPATYRLLVDTGLELAGGRATVERAARQLLVACGAVSPWDPLLGMERQAPRHGRPVRVVHLLAAEGRDTVCGRRIALMERARYGLFASVSHSFKAMGDPGPCRTCRERAPDHPSAGERQQPELTDAERRQVERALAARLAACGLRRRRRRPSLNPSWVAQTTVQLEMELRDAAEEALCGLAVARIAGADRRTLLARWFPAQDDTYSNRPYRRARPELALVLLCRYGAPEQLPWPDAAQLHAAMRKFRSLLGHPLGLDEDDFRAALISLVWPEAIDECLAALDGYDRSLFAVRWLPVRKDLGVRFSGEERFERDLAWRCDRRLAQRLARRKRLFALTAAAHGSDPSPASAAAIFPAGAGCSGGFEESFHLAVT
jgi:hypothetical protein